MPKIAIILPNLSSGGAERLHVNLAIDWIHRGYDVEFILMQAEGQLLDILPPQVKIKNLNVRKIRFLILPLTIYLWSSKPDIIIAAMWPLTSISVLSWLLTLKKGRLFLSDHIQLSVSCYRELNIKASVISNWMKWTYPFAIGIIAVSQGVKEDIIRLSGLAEHKIHVIYNPSAMGVVAYRASVTERNQLWGIGFEYHILSVGTLKLQKDHETLIKAFALIAENFNCKLIILGEGSCRKKLTELIEQLGLQTRIQLAGFKLDPSPWFRSADLFVLSSQWEGFGNVIVEALEFGIPVVSTNCPSGPSEILDNGRYGKLVPINDPVALAKAMVDSLMQTPNRDLLTNRAKDFLVSKISNQYLAYFFNI